MPWVYYSDEQYAIHLRWMRMSPAMVDAVVKIINSTEDDVPPAGGDVAVLESPLLATEAGRPC